MKIFRIHSHLYHGEGLAEAISALKEGKVVLHPTETCYGFAVDIFQEEALKALYLLKGMSQEKPTSMMVRSLKEAQRYAEFNSIALQLAEKFWPGPLTLVLPRKKTLPSFFNFGHETVGIRCPDSEVSRLLIEGVDRPLSTTSANLSGEPETYSIGGFLEQRAQCVLLPRAERAPQLRFRSKKVSLNSKLRRNSGMNGFDEYEPAVIIDAGDLAKNLPSTLIGFQNSEPVILREGSLLTEVRIFLETLTREVRHC